MTTLALAQSFNQRFSTLMRAMLAALGTNLAFTGLGIITGLIIARGLGPAGRGELSAVLAAPTLLAWAAGLGIEKANIYVLGQQPERGPALFANSLWFSLIVSVPVVLLAQAVAPAWLVDYRPEVVWVCRLYLLTIPAALFSTFVNHLVQGVRAFRVYNLTRLVTPVVNVCLLVTLWAAGRLAVEAALLSQALALGATLAAMLFGLRRHLAFSLRPDWALFTMTLRYGVKAHLGTLASLANVRLDQMVMVPLVPAADLGLYAVAARLSEVLWQISAAVALVLFPAAAARSRREAGRLTGRLMAGSAVVLITIAALLFAGAPWLLALFGPDFPAATLALRVLIVAAVFNGLSEILNNGLRGMGQPGLATLGDLAALAILPLLVVVIPRYGIVGAAWLSAAGYGIDLLVLAILFFRAARPAALKAGGEN